MNFKENLKELRLQKGLTQKQLAKELHFSLSAINKWENGKKEPSISSLIILAKYFQVSTDFLLGLEN